MSKKGQSSSYYPVFLDIDGKRCVVIGGGAVALRKVNTLLENGAKVEVISPELCPELAANRKISISRRAYQPGDLTGAFLAIVATDNSETNHQIALESRSRGVLVNVVDDAEYSDFILPSLVQRGDITIAVSTAGKSPALARKLRTRLEKEFGEEYAVLLQIIEEIRSEIKRRGLSIDSETWQDALDLDLLAGLIEKGQTEKAREIITQNLLKQHNEVRQV
ncbi:MAG: bifunctional precorrin-2 dehydrogenase/sirohydrochlorin ferrochelatase [Dehalococcoidales bacterium]|nr:bifunctional precorrin-2 dehydrogenase/sirohydrochlorin ferrochelatase [Dehalococcoidales bacterium]